ncbi:hypothetical protein K488DRAFT_76891 [Vararia minispora EC-137]|uniref:Uncharacterized protein n=1 Tax=Vararia minispora EC-137 TaxID=1314806 RepID=A0ACB8QTI9_9AGAM|nr:hypothetical protein K488DRAFT_76891 [Vararia minispora EC-137]
MHGLSSSIAIALCAASALAGHIDVHRGHRIHKRVPRSALANNSTLDGASSTENTASAQDGPARLLTFSTTQERSLTSSLLSALFPVSYTSSSSSSFSTCPSAPNALPLSDATLRPQAVMSSLSHAYVQSPGANSRLAMRAHYPAGSVALGHGKPGGISFYAPGPASVDWTNAKEVTFGYSVMFGSGFDFNLGGKLPGLYGGVDANTARSCSGGRRDPSCWSTRLMFRQNGQGELYTYIPYSASYPANLAQCAQNAHSDCTNAYGASVGRGAFSFVPGEWTQVAMRLRLNDAGSANGEIEVWAAGVSVISATGLVISPYAGGQRSVFRGIMMQTFFGGHEAQWASPKDQDAYFADFSVVITQTF